jgi:hypothetical protein
MRSIVLLTLLLATVSIGQVPVQQDEDSPVAVLEFKWYRDRKSVPKTDARGVTPARAVIAENKKFQREARAQLSPGAIDPNTLTVDGRSEALEKITQESRSTPAAAVEGFTYYAKLRNQADAAIDVIFLEFQFTELANPTNRVRRQFLCAAKIKARQKMDLNVFSSLGPSDVISVESLSNEAGKLFESTVNINRVEYSNGAIIQRKDWNFNALKAAVDHAVSQPWGSETCRAL